MLTPNKFVVMKKKPVVLCVLDGWGEAPPSERNAIAQARTPTWDRLKSTGAFRTLEASGPAVGLPEGQMGNSEVGHLTLGAGQILLQDLPRITQAVESNTLKDVQALQEMVLSLKETGGACHLMGLLSPGGIHSHIEHIKALISEISAHGMPIHIHGFLDGRDTPPSSAAAFVKELLDHCEPLNAHLSTLSGRYYAMDRDQNWDRIKPAYEAVVEGKAPSFSDPLDFIQACYERGITDEFISPAVAEGYEGVSSKDAVLVANFRADRVRQFLKALTLPAFDGFDRVRLEGLRVYGMTSYADWLDPYVTALFPPQSPESTLGEVLEKQGLTQYRIAETEKYAHVTYFFNGGREEPYDGEDRQLVQSPKVATYDLKPEMSAHQVTDLLCEAVESGGYDFLLVNYANPDMVGHTGNQDATIKAIEKVDACLNQLEESVLAQGGMLLITADHGNADCMENPQTQKPHTAHTCAPVPFVLVGKSCSLRSGSAGLSDVAPTVLDLLTLKSPVSFTGTSLISKD